MIIPRLVTGVMIVRVRIKSITVLVVNKKTKSAKRKREIDQRRKERAFLNAKEKMTVCHHKVANQILTSK